MKRRDFLSSSAFISGILLPAFARAQAKPCPPGTFGVQGGTSVAQKCGVGGGSADWVKRSTGPGVIWAHDFSNAEEVTRHLKPIKPKSTPVPCSQVKDGDLFALQQVCIGAKLAADFPAADGAGPRTMVIDNADDWPTGNFYFMVCKQWPNIGSKNLFLCSGREGNSLTVTYVPDKDSWLAATQQDYVIGDYAGNENESDWRRTFSALPAGENGLPNNDRAAAGEPWEVPVRSKQASGIYGVPRDPSIWQYGWYGHPSNQATWENWRGWTYGGSNPSYITQRGPINGSAPKYRLWDGSEFWLQFRMKVDPRFWRYHIHPTPTGSYPNDGLLWYRKVFAIQSEVSSLNQLVAQFGPSNRYQIPSTNPSPFTLATYKATKLITQPGTGQAGTSFQPGSQWASTAITPSSMSPAGSAWEWIDNEWITFLIHVVPGRSGVAESKIEVSFARTDQPGYDGTYTPLISTSTSTIVYSGSGDYDYPDGPFTPSQVGRMDALPGFQSFGPMGFLNISQKADEPVPVHSYWIRYTQIIFSKQSIPAPSRGS